MMILSGYSTCEISDAWASLGDEKYDVKSGGFLNIPGLCLRTEGRMEGRAFTVTYGEFSDPVRSTETLGYPSDLCPSGSVLVMQVPQNTVNAIWGGLHNTRAEVKGISGILTNGFVRDITELQQSKVPIWSAGTSILSAKQRLRVVAIKEPLMQFQHPTLQTTKPNGVIINHGDYIVADCDGVIVIPLGRGGKDDSVGGDDDDRFLHEIRKRAQEIRLVDDKIKKALESEKDLDISKAFQRYR